MNVYDDAGLAGGGEPSPGDPVTAEQTQIDPDHLERLGTQLAARCEKWVTARQASGVEKRWIEDLDQYIGRDAATKQSATVMDAAEAGYPIRGEDTKVQRSTVYVNITRPKTNAAEARIANMLFPADDKNFGLKPTPNPALTQAAIEEARAQTMPDPQPKQQAMPPGAPGVMQAPQQMPPQLPIVEQITGLYPQPSAIAQMNVAIQKAKAMEEEIADALLECDYNAQGRLMLHDCAVLGTGILKGPIVVNRVSKSWTPLQDGKTHVLEIVQETRPASERVDPWNVYPDPACGEDVHAGTGIFERKTYTGKQLRELASQPGYLKHQISKVLEEGPKQPKHQNERDRKDRTSNEPLYEVFEYWGEFTPEDLRACGVECSDGSTTAISGCVILVNGIVIKGFLNPLETGELPYDFMVWERADNSPWGYGIPFLCRPAQKVLTAAWRQMMDNAGLSVGPNVILKPSIIQPADKQWQITGRKIWNCLDDSIDVRTAFHLFELPNNSEEFQKIIELALRFVDEETAVPMLAQGEQGQAPETVGGMTILMNSANVVLTRMAKQFDDMITRRHIRRYYDWFMQFSDKADIKGDFQVDARGSTALLVRDMQQQALIQLGQFQGTQVGGMINWKAWIKEVLKTQHISHTDILKTDAEIAEMENAPPPPMPEEIKRQAAIEVAKIRADASLRTAQARESGELSFAQTQAQMAAQNHDARIAELQMKRELALLEYATQQKISLDAVKADLAKTAMIEETKRQLKAAELSLQANENDKDRLAEPPQLS